MRDKILIVEDNTELLELLRITLKQAGFSVSVSRNGVEGLKKARTFAPDLIVLDLVLPELDGFAVCESLRRDQETSSIPVIIMTGLTSEFTRYAGLESGGNEYITKPLSPEHLVSRIRHWLDQPKTTDRKSLTASTAR
jgi:two-component system alkaline phosphatase synthesis response regulator PhoP